MFVPTEDHADTLFLEPLGEGCSLVAIDLEALLDGFFVVVGATLFDGAVEQAGHKHVFRHNEFEHNAHFVATFLEHGLQCLGLCDGAGESVEDYARASGAFVVGGSEDVDHQRVGNELSVVDVSFGNFAKFSAGLDFATEDVAGGDVSQSVLADEFCTVGTLTRARSAEDDDVFHG